MKRRFYLVESEDGPSLEVAREILTDNGHGVAGPEGTRIDNVHPVAWANACVAVLPMTDQGILRFGICLGQLKYCVAIDTTPDMRQALSVQLYLPPGRIFRSWPEFARFAEFEAECPF